MSYVKKSTTTAVLSLTEEILKLFENLKYEVGVLILPKHLKQLTILYCWLNYDTICIMGTPLSWYEIYP